MLNEALPAALSHHLAAAGTGTLRLNFLQNVRAEPLLKRGVTKLQRRRFDQWHRAREVPPHGTETFQGWSTSQDEGGQSVTRDYTELSAFLAL